MVNDDLYMHSFTSSPPPLCFGLLTPLGYFYEKLPVYITLVSSAFLLIGGGQLVFAAMTVALVADIVEPSSR